MPERCIMSRILVPAAPLPRPTLCDFFMLLTGCSLSMILTSMGTLRIAPADGSAGRLAEFFSVSERQLIATYILCLSEGIILMLPVFHVRQRLLGRTLALTSAEWLWVFAWLGIALLALWETLRFAGVLQPEYASRPHYAWYMILVPAMALVAFIIALLGLVGKWRVPWTHTLGLVLMIWPAVPLILLLLVGLELRPR